MKQDNSIHAVSPFTGNGKTLGTTKDSISSKDTKTRLIHDFFGSKLNKTNCPKSTCKQEANAVQPSSSGITGIPSINQARIDYFLKKDIQNGPVSDSSTSNCFKKLHTNTKLINIQNIKVENASRSKVATGNKDIFKENHAGSSKTLNSASKRKRILEDSVDNMATSQKTLKSQKHFKVIASFDSQTRIENDTMRSPSASSSSQIQKKKDVSKVVGDENSSDIGFVDLATTYFPCPVCGKNIEESLMNSHLDRCLISD